MVCECRSFDIFALFVETEDGSTIMMCGVGDFRLHLSDPARFALSKLGSSNLSRKSVDANTEDQTAWCLITVKGVKNVPDIQKNDDGSVEQTMMIDGMSFSFCSFEGQELSQRSFRGDIVFSKLSNRGIFLSVQ